MGVGAGLTMWIPTVPAPKGIETALAGLIAAAVCEASNALIKAAVYAKELRKARAAQEFSSTGALCLEAMGRR